MIWLSVFILPFVVALVMPTLKPGPHLSSCLLVLATIPALVVGMAVEPFSDFESEGLFLGSAFGLDSIRRVFLLFTALLWAVAGAFTGYYEAGDRPRARFNSFFLMAMAGNLGLVISLDLISFYCFFVLMTFASFGLVVHTWTAEAQRAGHIYLILAVVGEIFLLAAIFLSVSGADSIRIEAIANHVAVADDRNWIIGLALLGFGAKAGAIPLYFWLPLAHPVAPTPASAVLSGAMIKAGLLGWLHLLPLGLGDFAHWGGGVVTAGFLAAIGGALIGLFQSHPKTLLAYSSISQMGMMTVLVGVGLSVGSLWISILPVLAFYALHHGLAKGALFLGTGVLVVTARPRVLVLLGLMIPALAIAGFPLTSGAIAKYGFKSALEGVPDPFSGGLAILYWVSAVTTAVLMGRFLWLCGNWSEEASAHGRPRPLIRCWVPLLLLVLFIPLWFPVLSGLELQLPGLGIRSCLESLVPLLAAGFILWLVSLRGWPACRIPAGDLLVPIERALLNFARRHPWHLSDWWEKEVLNVVNLSDRIMALERTKSVIDRLESRLGAWSMVGVLFALSLLVLLAFLNI